jgi:3-hydroxybutyryl-CoA dehydrogenase
MKVTIVGTGLMGQGLAQVFSQSEKFEKVLWIGRKQDSLNKAFSKLEKTWKKLADKGKFSETEVKSWKNKIQLSLNLEDSANANFVVEAITEDLEAKKNLFSKLSEIVSDETILTSNSSSMSITEIASVTKNPKSVVGMHFFNPPAIMKLVEIVVGEHTSMETISEVKEIANFLKKKPIEVKETPGFVVNRMLIPMINEAVGLLAENIAQATEIDQAMLFGANHPIGPLALADLIGNDVVLAIMETLRTETGDPKYRPHPMLRRYVRAGKLGRKSGEGFF